MNLGRGADFLKALQLRSIPLATLMSETEIASQTRKGNEKWFVFRFPPHCEFHRDAVDVPKNNDTIREALSDVYGGLPSQYRVTHIVAIDAS